ncbi:MAG: AAA family ATPase [Lachnoclostridium sp.]|jgi:AAA+ ATPase superfamily predicted ATPase|nr:AAA family ATPase [Lachnoclostridium sp.]
MFIGREQEIKFFEDKYNSPGGQLVVLYGRRRIGKTEILHHFCEGKPHVFYSCRELSNAKQLAAFSERILKAGSPASKYVTAFEDWETAFESILELPSGGKKKLLIIDEFPYMCKGDLSIPSILQILWDENLKNQDVMIVLCGSAMSFIEKKILSEKKPLYGRATGIYKMYELPFDDAIKFFPHYSDEDKMLAYSILGGIPHYLRQFDPSLSLRDNVIKNVLTKGCILYNEVEFLIRQELREPAFYNTVIEAIALGNTKLNDIYMKTQIDKAKISVYLKNLMELQILEREFSVLSGDKEQATSTRGLYRITDNFFRFWFSFVSPNLSDLETGDADGVFAYAVEPQFNDFASNVFETVCREFVRKKNRLGELSFRVSKLGRWWGKLNQTVLTEGKEKITAVDTEIDIVAVDAKSKNYILGECKFRNSEMDMQNLEHLKGKSEVAKKGAAIQYALFSKSGFTKGLTEQADVDESIKLFSLSDVVNE